MKSRRSGSHIQNFPFIEASSLGRIKTKDRVITGKNGKKYHFKGQVLKQQREKNGYMRVKTRVSGKYVDLSVHRVIAASHLPNPNNLPEVNHIDCDPTNNRLDNLEWCTHQENITYRDKLGHFANNNPGRPVIAVDLSEFKVLRFESQQEAARQLGVYVSNLNKVVKGKLNKTGDCWFCYADETAIEKTRSKFGDDIANKVEELINENNN